MRKQRAQARPTVVKCLTVRQPWAWLLVNGFKDIENRSWTTKHRGPLLIHASQQLAPHLDDIRKDILRRFGIKIPDKLETGGIVGQVEIADCVTTTTSPWFLASWRFRKSAGFITGTNGRLPDTDCEPQTHQPESPLTTTVDDHARERR